MGDNKQRASVMGLGLGNNRDSEMLTNVAPPWFIKIRDNPLVKNTVGLTNIISTTKYNIITWLPKSLFEQFRRIANIYFLVISIMMIIGTYFPWLFQSPLEPLSTVTTLIFVLMVTSCKEGAEDYQRYKSDSGENNKLVTVITFEGDKIIETQKRNQEVNSGDIIKLTGHCSVPVDLLLIISSYHEGENQCYVETANIDGETNLKLKEAPAALKPLVFSGNITKNLFKGSFEVEPANDNIHTFIGSFSLDCLEDKISLSESNLLLRSSIFSNTDWGYGIAIYCGKDTKIQMNSRHAPSKMSKIEGYLNKAIITIFCAQCIMVTTSIISIYALGFQDQSNLPYVYPNNEQGDDNESILPLWLEQWFVFFILYNNFIPISLYVSIEMVNLGQSYLMEQDIHMYDEPLDCACQVRSSNLVQELGMVSNIFSDKTGTLTANEMNFVQYVINGQMHHIKPDTPMHDQLKLPDAKESTMYKFLRCLSACHTVIREKSGDYRAESPDELALIQGVAAFNCGLRERSTTSMNVELLSEMYTFDILAVNAFNSDRKRMSILVRDVEKDEYYVFCKGADNIMIPLCKMDAAKTRSLDKSLRDLAVQGLRTLCIAEKKLDKSYVEKWLQDKKDAGNLMVGRADKEAEVAAELELNMDLLGLTAIEDRLQDEVPEVIAELAEAGIVLWMLTGDKEETAENIGRSCNLVTENSKLVHITKIEGKRKYAQKLKSIYDLVVENYKPGEGYIDDGKLADLVLVMDGPSFTHFDEFNSDHVKWFLKIGESCRSVVACRLTPIQKQLVVRLVKENTFPKATTLSIGDGANDVSMIREADVGIGIYGKEGRHAANNADVAIGQFKFLRRLILVHGRWNYIRQARVFLYCMHKNMVLTCSLFWYSYFTAVSGTSPYESYVYTGFNFMLGLPIIFYGIQDRDIPEDFVLKYPQVYSTGKSNTFLTSKAIAMWIFNAVITAVIICVIGYYAMKFSFYDWSLFPFGTTVFVSLVMSLQLKIIYLNNQWDKVRFFIISISVLGTLLFIQGVSYTAPDFYGVANQTYSDPLFWFFGMFTVPCIVLLCDCIGYNLNVTFRATKEIYFREASNADIYNEDILVKLNSKANIEEDEDAANYNNSIGRMSNS